MVENRLQMPAFNMTRCGRHELMAVAKEEKKRGRS